MSPKKKEAEVEIVEDSITEFRQELDHEDPEDVKTFISTGSTLLDFVVANRSNGGIPVGRITEICGNTSSGKSLLTYHIISNTQKMGGIAVYLDIERSMSPTFMERMGVDLKTLVTPKKMPYDIEELFDFIEKIVILTKKKFPNKEKLVTIVVDSVASLKSHEETERENTEAGKPGSEARSWSRGLRKNISILDEDFVTIVLVNQLRDKMATMGYGEKWSTPGGRAIPFYTSTRIKLDSIGKIKDKNDIVVGRSTKASVQKSKLGPAFRDVEFPILYSWGIQDAQSILDFLVEKKVAQGAAYKNLKLYDQEFSFKNSEWADTLKTNEEMRNLVLKYLEEQLVDKFEKPPSSETLSLEEGRVEE